MTLQKCKANQNGHVKTNNELKCTTKTNYLTSEKLNKKTNGKTNK